MSVTYFVHQMFKRLLWISTNLIFGTSYLKNTLTEIWKETFFTGDIIIVFIHIRTVFLCEWFMVVDWELRNFDTKTDKNNIINKKK